MSKKRSNESQSNKIKFNSIIHLINDLVERELSLECV